MLPSEIIPERFISICLSGFAEEDIHVEKLIMTDNK